MDRNNDHDFHRKEVLLSEKQRVKLTDYLDRVRGYHTFEEAFGDLPLIDLVDNVLCPMLSLVMDIGEYCTSNIKENTDGSPIERDRFSAILSADTARVIEETLDLSAFLECHCPSAEEVLDIGVKKEEAVSYLAVCDENRLDCLILLDKASDFRQVVRNGFIAYKKLFPNIQVTAENYKNDLWAYVHDPVGYNDYTYCLVAIDTKGARILDLENLLENEVFWNSF